MWEFQSRLLSFSEIIDNRTTFGTIGFVPPARKIGTIFTIQSSENFSSFLRLLRPMVSNTGSMQWLLPLIAVHGRIDQQIACHLFIVLVKHIILNGLYVFFNSSLPAILRFFGFLSIYSTSVAFCTFILLNMMDEQFAQSADLNPTYFPY
ncbi:MAG: hypothetical protein C4527_20550 [Candidatus Omnitrophota bacterium]|nr:MAG: hypothetical protein C4527_20550 [Candidatus Omnitrophota bacterium]